MGTCLCHTCLVSVPSVTPLICQSLVLSVKLAAEHEGHGTIHANLTFRNQSAAIVQVSDTLTLSRLQSNSQAINFERERNQTLGLAVAVDL